MVSTLLILASLTGLAVLGAWCFKALHRRAFSPAFYGLAFPPAVRKPTDRSFSMRGKRWQSATGHSPGVNRVTGLTKTEAEDLLDWLEATGRAATQVSYRVGEGFFVQY